MTKEEIYQKHFVKLIAQAIIDAQKMREDSYHKEDDETFGHYMCDYEYCFQEACEKNNLPPTLWHVLYLANHWHNDLRDWAQEQL